MLELVDHRTTFKFYPALQLCLPPDERMYLELQAPDMDVLEEVGNHQSRTEQMGTKFVQMRTHGTQQRVMLSRCIKGWGGVTLNGKPVKFNPNKVDEMLSMLPMDIKDEAFAKLTNRHDILDAFMAVAQARGLYQEPEEVADPELLAEASREG